MRILMRILRLEEPFMQDRRVEIQLIVKLILFSTESLVSSKLWMLTQIDIYQFLKSIYIFVPSKLFVLLNLLVIQS